jgi:hypothetical protein
MARLFTIQAAESGMLESRFGADLVCHCSFWVVTTKIPLLEMMSEALELDFSGLSSLKNPRSRNWAYFQVSSIRTPIILSECVFRVCMRTRRAAVFVFLAASTYAATF